MSQISHYFIILSEHNIAEYRACLHLQPDNVHLIVTEWVARNGAHTRFKKTLEANGQFHGKIHEIGLQDGNRLTGERTAEIRNWLDTAFKKHCEQHGIKNNAVLNITGGTKILSLLLAAQADTWQALHYQPFLRNSDKIFIDCLHPQTLQQQCEITLPDQFPLVDALKLYADKIDDHSTNPITTHPDSLPLAKMRFAAQSMTQPENGNLFPAVIPVLENAWIQKYPTGQKEVLLEWQEFAPVQTDELKPFFERLIRLIEAEDRIRLDGKGLIIPTKYNKSSQIARRLLDWKNWLNGNWFEQLVYTWFKENGVPDEKLATGLQLKHGESQGNETDILLFHKNQLIFCELKSDLSPTQKLKDLSRQLLAQSENMGKVRRVLILSPKIQNERQEKQEWKEFQRDCESRHIKIIIAHNADSLKELIN